MSTARGTEPFWCPVKSTSIYCIIFATAVYSVCLTLQFQTYRYHYGFQTSLHEREVKAGIPPRQTSTSLPSSEWTKLYFESMDDTRQSDASEHPAVRVTPSAETLPDEGVENVHFPNARLTPWLLIRVDPIQLC